MSMLTAPLDSWVPGAVKHFWAAGSTATAQLTCTGIKTTDEIRSADYYPASGLPSSVLAEISIPADGKVACASTNTSSGAIRVEWISAGSLTT